MQSLSKTPVSLSTAQKIVRNQFGARRTIETFEELKDGFFNASYKIVLDDRFACVLKVAPPVDVRVQRHEHELMSAEVEVMRLVRAQTEMPNDQLVAHGPSLHHIAFEIKGMSERIATLAEHGLTLVQRGDYTGGRYAYLDGQERFGAGIELLEND